jgi:HK97 family phage major capsid protein
MSFGKRELHPRPLAKRIKISRKLLSRLPGAEGLVTQRLAYKFAVSEEKAFLTGTGANGPLGVFTASSYGISTGRDVSSGNTSTAITMDGLINALYSLKAQYQTSPTTAWLFHRDAVKMIRKLRDDSGASAGTGQYLWQPSTQVGEPDTLLGLPVFTSEYAPNTFTTGLYVGLVGDFSNYWIADADTFSVQRLVELYAEANQVGLIGRKETDGMPVLEEAFARVTLA